MDGQVPGFLGRVLDGSGRPVGTCFQVAPGVIVTARHVLLDAMAVDDAGGLVDAQVMVDGLAVGAAEPRPAVVAEVDAAHDLAVARLTAPLPGDATTLAASDTVGLGIDIAVIGHGLVEDAAHPDRTHRHMTALGVWAGGTMRDDAIALARISSKDVLRGMSGAPVLRVSDGAVVGVVSARYNSADGWFRDTAWVARTEDVVALVDRADVVLRDAARLSEPADLTFTVDATTVRLSGAGVDVTAAHDGVRPGLAGAIDDVRRARGRAGTTRTATVSGPATVAEPMRRVGELMAASFLPDPVRAELAGVMRRAEAASMPVHLGIRFTGAAAGFAGLPWEALPDPAGGGPLALHRLVTVYRGIQAATPRKVPGPLRVVVAIASPVRGGGAMLDYERELRAVLTAVKGARAGLAQVRIVPFATTAAIRAALAGGDVHVLHVSAHGGPGVLVLEDEDGGAREVSAARFLAEAIPPGCMPPVIALAACHTDVAAARASDADGHETAMTSFAAELMGHGAAAVIGTETSVTDRYATRVFARVYTELAQAPVPDVVAGLAQARRAVHDQLAVSTDPRDQAIAGLGEWAVVTVLAGAGSTVVFDPTTTAAAPLGPAEPATRRIKGLPARDPGEFVGRRVEQRRLPALLLDGTGRAGVALHGIGGVGKTTLAAEVVRRSLERDPNLVVATVTGQTNVDAVLAEIAAQLRAPLVLAGGGGPALQVANALTRVDLPWQDRVQLLADHVLDTLPLLLVLDNFEDNLTGNPREDAGQDTAVEGAHVADEGLAGLVAALATAPGRARLLITSRYPFTLPGQAHTRLEWRHLGPLTFAETMKLAWSLPQLDELPDADLRRIWLSVGGHPRTLEYVDALLAHGTGRLADITDRLRTQVEKILRTPAAATAWFAKDRDLDAAIADALTVAADDVLLDQLLADLPPQARRLLLALSVYREPVDTNAILFAAGEVDEDAAWEPDRQAAEQRILATLEAHGLDAGTLNEALQAGDLSALPAPAATALAPDLSELAEPPRPPRSTTLDLPHLVRTLESSSLLTVEPDTERVFVHRWTASELTRRWTAHLDIAPDLTAANKSAAAYWQWRVEVWPQDRQADIHDLLEARHHLHAAGDDDRAGKLTEQVCLQLDTWGAWDHEHALIQETRTWLGPTHPREPAYLHQLGNLAYLRGDYPAAETWYQQSLTIEERLGNQAGMASSYHQLGMLAQDRGDYPAAETRYQQALTIFERLDNQTGMATSYHQLGNLAYLRGDYPAAETRYQQALTIKERLGNQAGMATSYHQLGILAQARGDYPAAETRYQQALTIEERLGNQAGMASSYHQLGILAQARGDYPAAETRYQQSLTIEERLGNQAGMATSYGQLGMLAQDRGDYPAAETWYQQALTIFERLGNQAGMATSRSQLGFLRTAQGRVVEAIPLHLQALVVRLSLGLSQAGIDVRELAKLRAQIGAKPFEKIARKALDKESTTTLLHLLDQHDLNRA